MNDRSKSPARNTHLLDRINETHAAPRTEEELTLAQHRRAAQWRRLTALGEFSWTASTAGLGAELWHRGGGGSAVIERERSSWSENDD